MSPSTAALFAAGLVWWTLVEYGMHRGLLHGFSRFFGRRHLLHHAHVEVKRYALAPLPSALFGAVVHAAAFFPLFGVERGLPLFLGLLTGYLAYESVHFSIHYLPPFTPFGRSLRRNHVLHHHVTPEARFGVTSPLWDFVFGTRGRVP